MACVTSISPAAAADCARIDGELQYLRTMSEGMAGMVHADDVRVAEELRPRIELPSDPAAQQKMSLKK